MRHAALYVAKLLRFAFEFNPALYLSVVLSLVSVAVELAAVSSLVPLSTLALGQSLAPDSNFIKMLKWAGFNATLEAFVGLFVVFFGLRLLVQLASQGMAMYFGRKLLAQLASSAFENIVRGMSLKEIEAKSIGYFISLAGDESFRASTIVISIIQFVGISALALLYFMALIFYSAKVALGVAVFLALTGLVLLGSMKRSQSLGSIQVDQSRAAGSIFLDALNGLRAVKAFSAEKYVIASYTDRMFQYVRTLFQIDLINLLSRVVPALLLLVGLLILVHLYPMASNGAVSPAVLVTILVLLLRFFPVTGQALSVLMRIVADTKTAKDVLAVADPARTGLIGIRHASSDQITSDVRKIEIRGLSFSHDSKKPVFTGFNARLESGKSYALIGPSGSGKSTLFDLLLGFYAIQEGEIEMDGTPITRLSIGELRRKVLLVSQQTVIFNDTVENNVRFGQTTATREQVEMACSLARIHEVIIGLPNGYDTVLSYQGTNLSGGQRQRIGVARALVRRPDVLLLDEVTAGLDHQTRDELVTRVLSEFRSKIVVFATHDRELASMVDEVIDVNPSSYRVDPMPLSSGA